MKKNKKPVTGKEKQSAVSLSKTKKRLFWTITILLPFVVFILLEITLQVINYGGNLDLFIDGPPGYENYLRCNDNVARRYFSQSIGIPTPPLQLFLKEKPANAYRIFVLGGSSAAGFPYGNNISFPGVLRRALTKTFPEKNIEVINVAMSAVNSYTLLDLTGEILDQSPDALLIYAGHNEYYGALGVGSVQSLGNWRGLIRTYLKLQSFRTFLLLRDFIGWMQEQTGQLLSEDQSKTSANTLMSRVVGEQTIPFGSTLYELGKKQFEENLREIIRRAKDNNVEVVLGELVSNIKDQKPFISVEDENGVSANSLFNSAKKDEVAGNYTDAETKYRKAKDYDALRFRAPEEFNEIIKKYARDFSIPFAPTVSYFKELSPNGLIGNSLILEHLHPNKEGYYLLAKVFYETMRNHKMISPNWTEGIIEQEKNTGNTALDSVYGEMVISHLKQSWPFQPKDKPNTFFNTFRPKNELEEMSLKVMQSKNFNLEAGHMELGNLYEKRGEYKKAFCEYNALIASIPHEMEFYQKTVTVLILDKNYDAARELLIQSLKYKENLFAYKWIGQIALLNDDNKTAIDYLSKADFRDPQVIFNLARAYYFDQQWYKGEEYFSRLKNIDSKSKYLSHLAKVRMSAKQSFENYLKRNRE